MLKAFSLDWSSPIPLEEQIVQQLQGFQEVGLLQNAHQLPTIRELAVELHVAPAIIEKAYRCWQQEGVINFITPMVLQAKVAGYSKEQFKTAIEQVWDNL